MRTVSTGIKPQPKAVRRKRSEGPPCAFNPCSKWPLPTFQVIGAETMSLSGKTLFVTGASRGIGLAIALRAARDGANVAIAAKTAEPHKHLPGTIYTAAAEIEKAGGK